MWEELRDKVQIESRGKIEDLIEEATGKLNGLQALTKKRPVKGVSMSSKRTKPNTVSSGTS